MFGREPRLAIDVALNIPEMPGQQSYTKYVKDLKTRLRGVYEQAAKHTQKASLQQKTYYDRKARAGTLSVGGYWLGF